MTKRNSFGAAALLCGALLAFPAAADAQIHKQGKGYLFRAKFKKGETLKYDMNTTITGMPQPMVISMPMQMTVDAVAKEIADITAKVGPISMNGKPFDGGQAQTSKMKMNRMGKVVGGGQGSVGVGASLPEKPLAIGGTYTSPLPLGPAVGGGDALATYKFVGIKKVDGKSVAEMAVTVGSDGPSKVEGSGTIYLLVSDASLHKASLAMKMVAPPSARAPGKAAQDVRFNIVMKRV